MGLSLSLLSKLGVPGVSSVTTDQFYEKFFKGVGDFHEFHAAFIDLCKFINDVMPGKHFEAPTKNEIKKFYEEINWKNNSEDQRRVLLTEYVKEKVTEVKTDDDKAVIITGMVVPAAAVVLKNSAENMQPVKRFKLHLIPNFVFVPTCTFLALAGVQLMQVRKKSKS